ncbi:MAG TPA: hypothetical protein VIV82_08480, partial [Verrucomicrobiae bacterium]
MARPFVDSEMIRNFKLGFSIQRATFTDGLVPAKENVPLTNTSLSVAHKALTRVIPRGSFTPVP